MIARSPLVLLGLLAACSDKTSGTDTGTPPADDSAATDDSDETADETPVWTSVRIETSSTLKGLYPMAASVVVVGEEGGAWFRQSDAWAPNSVETDGENLNDVWGAGSSGDSNLQLVAVGNVGVVATYSGGEWTVGDVGTANFEAVDGPASANLLAVGWGGVFSNSSGTFEYTDVASGRYNDVWWNGTAAMAVGEDGDYAVYQNDNWADDALPSRKTLYGVTGTAADDVWAVGEGGLVAHWDGSVWTEQEAFTDASLWDVWAASASDVDAVGNNGEAWRYDGASWSALPTGVDNNLYAVHGVSAVNMWVTGNRGMAMQYKPE